jgi:Protein of unknown function (DUF2442)
MIDVTGVRSVAPHQLEISFSDGTVGVRDFTEMVVREGEMLRPLKDPAYFSRVFVEDGALTWRYDVDPIELHRRMKEAGQLRQADAAE